jgi:uncharacterized protein YbjT (DUF2867 family)
MVGRQVVESLRAEGHDVEVLSRATGVDVHSGQGLRAALSHANVVIDTLNTRSQRRSTATDFFITTSSRLQETAAEQGVEHIVSLSILGIDAVPGYPYYDAKLAQERTVTAGPVPTTILRAAQFHEFPAQLLAALRLGPLALVPHTRSQPVAARTVGVHLAKLAIERPGGRLELAGPAVHDVADLARRLAVRSGQRLRVIAVSPPGRASRAMRGDALLAGASTTIDGPTFEEWLASEDAADALSLVKRD